MADLFMTNSDNTKAVRKSQVDLVDIIEAGEEEFIVQLKLTDRPIDVPFEAATTLASAKTKASTILTNLEDV